MTRSEAALKRRAAKRNRSIEEQRLKDNMEDGNKINSNNDNVKKRKMEDNNNTNNKKHYKIISKGGFNIMVSKRRTDNNGNASKVLIPKLKWPEQAGPERIKYNQNLRERYNQDRTGLDDKELERALILIKRDQRKKEKKLKQKIERERKKEMRRIRKERHNALINQSKK